MHWVKHCRRLAEDPVLEKIDRSGFTQSKQETVFEVAASRITWVHCGGDPLRTAAPQQIPGDSGNRLACAKGPPSCKREFYLTSLDDLGRHGCEPVQKLFTSHYLIYLVRLPPRLRWVTALHHRVATGWNSRLFLKIDHRQTGTCPISSHRVIIGKPDLADFILSSSSGTRPSTMTEKASWLHS